MCYMDVDQSTDLHELPKLVQALHEGGYDIAIGSRLLPESKVQRSLEREIISRLYNLFLKLALGVGFSDAQCGFKAITREAAAALVPNVEDESWFFDTELLVLAERDGRSIADLPVVWSEDDDSRVKIVSTAWDDIKGVMRLRRQFRAVQAQAPRSGAIEGRHLRVLLVNPFQVNLVQGKGRIYARRWTPLDLATTAAILEREASRPISSTPTRRLLAPRRSRRVRKATTRSSSPPPASTAGNAPTSTYRSSPPQRATRGCARSSTYWAATAR